MIGVEVPKNVYNKPVQIIEGLDLEAELRECNELKLRSRRIIAPDEDKNLQPEEPHPNKTLTVGDQLGEDTVRQKTLEQIITTSPPFPEILMILCPIEHLEFDLLGEFKNICKETPVKYEDPGNPIVIVQINGHSFPNALVDLGATINIITTTTCEMLGITALEPTTTLLELANHSVIRPKGTLPDVMVSVDTWEYPKDFLIINPRNLLDGHPLILGRPWLATADTYISGWTGSMTITRGYDVKNIALYPPSHPSLTIVKTRKQPITYLIENIWSPLTVVDALEFKNQTEDDVINNFINHPATVSSLKCHMIKAFLDNEIEEYSLRDINDQPIPTTTIYNSTPIEIKIGNILNISSNPSDDQQQKLIQVLRKYKGAFAWDYLDMKGIDPQLCMHHIYTEKDARPIQQPRHRLNPQIKDIFKEELQKLLDVNFIYPISDSKWVSPLVVVPKKNGKWHICVDYRELKKET
eukprot:PITA_24783